MLLQYNIFVYKNFLFFASTLGLFQFNFSSLFLYVFLDFSKYTLLFKWLKKNRPLNRNIFFLKLVNISFKKKLILFGIGFRCWVFKSFNDLHFIILKLGFSRDVCLSIPLSIKLICLKPTLLFLKSNNKLVLEQFAARLCLLKKFNLYKTKGLVSNNKHIVVKLGKKT